ncbi:hypothetical protein Afil01_52890 [Actinorhabdospora filicis]|uniref:DUF397 domain-containing protein n=1 Tax=Actinorhabdospora filicis TaxID=1785913 RepID=A0A9W6W5K4_9ACTN|nr:DUF397 domain-containing protein [Actinorhabdospora filicis]GLZ80482.1 hypothetical protein Afil01_52890 [Actinorhabdospora filicis]
MEIYRDYATWRRSTRSGQTGNCVEVADLGVGIGVRDTKDRDGGRLVVSASEWTSFVASLKH